VEDGFSDREMHYRSSMSGNNQINGYSYYDLPTKSTLQN